MPFLCLTKFLIMEKQLNKPWKDDWYYLKVKQITREENIRNITKMVIYGALFGTISVVFTFSLIYLIYG